MVVTLLATEDRPVERELTELLVVERPVDSEVTPL